MKRHFNGIDELDNALSKAPALILEQLVADTAIWIHRDIYRIVAASNINACFYPNSRRVKKGETVRTKSNGIYLDTNEKAIQTMKQCTGFTTEPYTYQVCRIYSATTYKKDYHTSIGNLVWMPAAIAGLSDGNHKNISDMLKKKSYDLYDDFFIGKKPEEPDFWSSIKWPEVHRPSDNLIKRIRNRFTS